MAVVYPDILLTLWDNWHAARLPAGCQDGRYDSFAETYLNCFLLMFRSYEEKVRLEEQKNIAILIEKTDAGRQEQIKDLKEFCLAIKRSACNVFVSPDDICDWLTNIFLDMPRERIERFRTKSGIVNEIRKYYSRTRNPAGNELSGKLRDALRALASADKIEGRDYGPDGRIRNETCFRLKTAPDRVAQIVDYEENREIVPFFHTRRRGGTVEHSSIITAKDAESLVEKLLEAFNGWTSFSDIQSVSWDHVPKTLKCVSDEKAEALSDADLIGEVSAADLEELAVKKSETIWLRICNMNTERFFCLYILPEKAKKAGLKVKPGKSARLEDFGKPATMTGKMAGVGEIFREELLTITIRHGKEVELDPEDALREAGSAGDAETAVRPEEDVRMIVQIVFRRLNRRCRDADFPTGVDLEQQGNRETTRTNDEQKGK